MKNKIYDFIGINLKINDLIFNIYDGGVNAKTHFGEIGIVKNISDREITVIFCDGLKFIYYRHNINKKIIKVGNYDSENKQRIL